MASDGERDDALFVNLVMIFQGAAMQQMGKIASPLTGKVERNLEQARFSIDTLAMLREKTRGNLSDDLARLLDSALLNLRMNYVEEAAAEGKATGAGAGDAGTGDAKAGEPEAGGAGGARAEAARPKAADTEPSQEAGAGEARPGEGRSDAGPRGGSRARRRRRAGSGEK